MEKDVVLLYPGCCIYEIVILTYFLKCTGSDVVYCSVDGGAIEAMEGYSVNADCCLNDVKLCKLRSFIIPGGDAAQIEQDVVFKMLCKLNGRNIWIGAICAGVDVLEKAGILKGRRFTRNADADCIRDGNIITARANAYVDFAIEMGKALELFEDEADLQETIDFWKLFKRAE